MKSKKLILAAFILVAMIQLFVPIRMISTQAGFAENGTEFKFKTKNRFNPDYNGIGSDISGKFIRLNFTEDHINITNQKDWKELQNAYVEFSTDSNGFAKILSVKNDKPANSSNWVRAGVRVNWKDSTKLQLFYPFNNYYIQDTNNKNIEPILKTGLCDTLKTNFLKIKIKENQFVSGDLMIDGVSFKDLIGKVQ